MDRLVWAYTPKVTFSVNSAYKVALSLTLATNSESTSHGRQELILAYYMEPQYPK